MERDPFKLLRNERCRLLLTDYDRPNFLEIVEVFVDERNSLYSLHKN